MLIDWFTVGAQMVNFIVLVGLMKRFLFKPILLAIDAREQRVARELTDADASKAEAVKERDAFRVKNEQFDQERVELMNAMTAEVRAERERLLNEARLAADTLSAKLRATYRTEAQQLKTTISHRVQQEVYAVVRKVLSELASSSLEEQLCRVFTERLRQLDGPSKARIGEAIRSATTPSLVRSGFELSDAERTIIRQAVSEVFSMTSPIRFETTTNVICGLEFSVNGQKVVWSLVDSLSSLEKGISELIDHPVDHQDVKTGHDVVSAAYDPRT